MIVQHIGNEHITVPQWFTTSDPVPNDMPAAIPNIDDQTDFTRELFRHWDVHARTGPAHLERLLHVHTWFLHSGRIRVNDEERLTTLGDNFHQWESQLQRIWLDLLDPHIDVDFAIVYDHVPGQLHIIVHQLLQHQECSTLITTYDDGVMNNRPHVTAAILSQQVLRAQFLAAINRQYDCPPLNLYTTCTIWQQGHEISEETEYQCRHGDTFSLIIQRTGAFEWNQEEWTATEAASSASFLQTKAVMKPTKPAEDRRLTTGQVAHTQWPEPHMLKLEDLISPPLTVEVDFSSVLFLANELHNTGHHFLQCWPPQLEMPEVTRDAMRDLQPLGDQIPLAYHFFTDGSKAAPDLVGAAVVLLIETATGWHYGGCLYRKVETGDTSVAGENGAITWALLWAFQLSNQHWEVHGQAQMAFSFNFDATCSGYLAAGYWRTSHAHSWRTLTRSIAQVLQTRHGIDALAWIYVKAHAGHPWNEAADALAKWVVQNYDQAQSSAYWEQWLDSPDKLTAFQWLWYKELMEVHDPRVPALCNGIMKCIIPVATPCHDHDATPSSQGKSETVCNHPLMFKIANANVMTLMAQTEHKPTVSRQHVLMQQFHEASCHVIGLQETRHRHLLALNNDLYHIVGHPATLTGQDGIQLWVSKRLPIDGEGTLIQRQDIKIVASAADYLIASLKLHTWRCIIVTCRAPHSGKPRTDAYQFWHNITAILQKKARGAPVFFCGDANAHLGEQITASVGPHQSSVENQAGALFHDWLLLHDLYLPATFQHLHHGEAATFLAPDGKHETRIDYVALPREIEFDLIESQVESNIDLSVHRHDHFAVSCRLHLKVPRRPNQRPRSCKGVDVRDLSCKLQQDQYMHLLHYSVSAPPWTLDPHASAEWLANSTSQAVSQIAQSKGMWKRKSHISAFTWDLVDVKKNLFKQLKSLKRVARHTTLQACFLSWRASSGAPNSSLSASAIQRDLSQWNRLHDHAVAKTTSMLRKAASDVQQAIKFEDSQYYARLADQSAQTYSVEGLTGIWKKLKAVLPKHRSKRFQVQRDIEHELLTHFQSLEAGQTVSVGKLIRGCLNRNAEERAREAPGLHLKLQELPTLAEVETLCLKQKPNKAPGPDGIPSDLCRQGAAAIAPQLHSVLCKAVLHGAEPVSYKGGRLCAIHKNKGCLDDAAGYRGILLANSFAKVTHAWARMRLLPTLQQRRTIGQIGGLPSQQTMTAVQLIRLHGIIGQAKGISTATLFIDLKSAFHHMIREPIFSTHNTLLSTTMATFLDDSEFDLEKLEHDLNEICASQVDDIPSGLRRFLHDLHNHTWFQLHGNEQQDGSCTQTLRGTRPGSPMADIGFNLMMSDILQEVTRQLNESEAFHEGARAIGTYVPPVAWVDDVAIALSAAHPSELVPLVQYTLAVLHSTFRSRGLSLNLDPGKTETIVCFRGDGAVQHRRELFLRNAQPTITVTTDTHVLTVRVVSSYRHLGVRYAMNMDIDSEISARLGAARQAFSQLKQPVFMNRSLPIRARIQLFQSLVLSRLLYGCAIWSEISSASFKKLDAMVTDCYRQIYGIGFWSPERVNDHDFMKDNGLIPFRIFLTRHRLGFLQHIAQHAITAHKTLLLMERTTNKGWLFEVEQDLTWFSHLRDLPFEIPHDRASWTVNWQQLRATPQWKAWIQRAVCKHIEQEHLANTVCAYHHSIRLELERFGMQLMDLTNEDENIGGSFPCSNCDAVFPTCQQLGVHAFRQHGIRALESMYVQSAVCPGCLKNFHTTYRVSQHLRYRANQCWERIFGVRQPADPGLVTLPPHLTGVHRLPAVRQHHGPLRPTAHHRECHESIERLRSWRKKGDATLHGGAHLMMSH